MSSPEDIRDMDMPGLTEAAQEHGWSLRVVCRMGRWHCTVHGRDRARLYDGEGYDMLSAMHAALVGAVAWTVRS